MAFGDVVGRGLAFGYKILGTDAQMSVPGAAEPVGVRVIFSQDGAAMLDGMMQSIGPSLRIRTYEAPAGVPRNTVFVLGTDTWKAREAGLPHNAGSEWLVQLGKA